MLYNRFGVTNKIMIAKMTFILKIFSTFVSTKLI